jgi:hypothetical protein
MGGKTNPKRHVYAGRSRELAMIMGLPHLEGGRTNPKRPPKPLLRDPEGFSPMGERATGSRHYRRWGVYEQTGNSDPADQGRRLVVEWTADL